MTGLLGTAALVCTLLGVVSAAAVLARTWSLAQALPVLLEFLMAAGLLRLTGGTTWRALATAAARIALRTLVVVHGLRPARGRAA